MQLRAEEIERLVERFHALGTVAAAAAREVGITRQTAGTYLAKRGKTVRHLTPAQVAHAAEAYQRGESAAAIGAQLGFNAASILKALREAGVSIRPAVGGPRRR